MLSADNERKFSGTKFGVLDLNFIFKKPVGNIVFAWQSRHVRAAAFLPKGVRIGLGGWERLGDEKFAGTDLRKYEPVTVWEIQPEGI